MIVLSGEAKIAFEDERAERRLRPGDYIFIAPHRRHRVAWTDPNGPTVWLALHYGEAAFPTSGVA